MNQQEIEVILRDHDSRLRTVGQILPTLLTRDEFKTAMAKVATKEDLERFATKADLERFATKADLERFATKADLERFATKGEVRADGVETRRHFDVIAESLRDDIKLIAEGHIHLARRLDDFEKKVETRFEHVELRLTRLESERQRRR